MSQALHAKNNKIIYLALCVIFIIES